MRRAFGHAYAGILTAVLIAASLAPSSATVATGAKAPDFTLPTLAGKSVSLKSVLTPAAKKPAPKAVLVDFWATWCGPCRQSIPHIQKLHELYGKKGLTVIGISVDRGSVKPVQSFVKDMKLTYTILSDSKMKTGHDYQIEGIPTLYLIDKTGVVRQVFVGYGPKTEAELTKAVTDMLK